MTEHLNSTRFENGRSRQPSRNMEASISVRNQTTLGTIHGINSQSFEPIGPTPPLKKEQGKTEMLVRSNFAGNDGSALLPIQDSASN